MIRTEAAKERKRQRNRERYFWLKSMGYCTQCGHEQAVPGGLFCIDCAGKHDEYNARYRAKNAERARANKRELYARCKAENKCVRCGADLGGNTGTRCEACRKEKNAEDKEWYRRNRKGMSVDTAKARGICVRCKQHEAIYNKTICTECYSVLKKQMDYFMNDRRRMKRCKGKADYSTTQEVIEATS